MGGKANALPTPVEQALGSLRTVEQEVKGLIKETSEIVIIDNDDKDGHDKAHAALMRIVDHRTQITKSAKAIRDPFIAAQKAVIDEEKRLVSLLEPEEARLRKARDDYREYHEKIKREKAEAERLRLNTMASTLLTMGFAFNGQTYSITHDDRTLDVTDVRLRLMDEEDYADFLSEAKDIVDAIALAKAEEERLAKEAAQNAERVRIANEKKAAELAAREAEMQRKADELAAREADIKRQQELRDAAEKAAAEAKAKAEAEAQSKIAAAQAEALAAKQGEEKAKAEAVAAIKQSMETIGKERDTNVLYAPKESLSAPEGNDTMTDKEWLVYYLASLPRTAPKMTTEKGEAILAPVRSRMENIISYLESNIANL
jgi:hypothetical protein